jgi:hypothetical protein
MNLGFDFGTAEVKQRLLNEAGAVTACAGSPLARSVFKRWSASPRAHTGRRKTCRRLHTSRGFQGLRA